MNLNNWFEKGLTTEEYIQYMQVNKENMLHIQEQFSLQLIAEAERLKNRNLRALVLTADWCGDAMVNLPIFTEIARAAHMDIRFFIRDENLELMDQYLTNGTARSIPIIVLINENGEEVAKWGPRAKNVQIMVDEMKKELPESDDSSHQEALKEFYSKIGKLYTTDSSIWKIIEKDMIETFTK
ncbi:MULTISPECIES: thioredoxin family protein [Bacillus]|uniref:thioredoxin family protein n=1 Tax=Bacillus TaxID=1386 RepID=UPI00031DF838|nr:MULTISPECIES: thioredoxin family protein [Bacillus]